MGTDTRGRPAGMPRRDYHAIRRILATFATRDTVDTRIEDDGGSTTWGGPHDEGHEWRTLFVHRDASDAAGLYRGSEYRRGRDCGGPYAESQVLALSMMRRARRRRRGHTVARSVAARPTCRWSSLGHGCGEPVAEWGEACEWHGGRS